MAGKKKEPAFGSVVNEMFRRSLGTTTEGHKIPENNRKINDWMREQTAKGSSTSARVAEVRDDLRGGKD